MSTTDETLAALDTAKDLKLCQEEIDLYYSRVASNRALCKRLSAGGFGRDVEEAKAEGKALDAKAQALFERRNALFLVLQSRLPGHPLLRRLERTFIREMNTGTSLSPFNPV